MAWPVHPVDQQDVLPAIGVVIEKRAAGPERLRQQLAAISAAVVPELQPGGGGDIDEAEAGRASRLASQRHRQHGQTDAAATSQELAPARH